MSAGTGAGWFAGWRCDCTDVQHAIGAISRTCPEHGAELLGPVEFLADIGEAGYGRLPGRGAAGSSCVACGVALDELGQGPDFAYSCAAQPGLEHAPRTA